MQPTIELATLDTRHDVIPLVLNFVRTAAQVLIAIGVAVIAW